MPGLGAGLVTSLLEGCFSLSLLGHPIGPGTVDWRESFHLVPRALPAPSPLSLPFLHGLWSSVSWPRLVPPPSSPGTYSPSPLLVTGPPLPSSALVWGLQLPAPHPMGPLYKSLQPPNTCFLPLSFPSPTLKPATRRGLAQQALLETFLTPFPCKPPHS